MLIDFDKAYRHPDYPGIAWRIDGYNQELARFDEEWYNEPEYVEDVTQVRCHMIGDDRSFLFDTEDMIELDDSEYCSECGQIGCGHG